VAERYWWNSLPGSSSTNSTWIDLSPRPTFWPQLLLIEEVEPKIKERTLGFFSKKYSNISKTLLEFALGTVWGQETDAY